ncbi:hypothetical protein D3C80_1130490 [compost metagenome]
MEQTVAIDTFQPFAFQLLGSRNKAVGTHNLQFVGIPQHQVIIVVVIAVQITTATGTFAHRAESNLTQPTELTQDRRTRLTLTAIQEDNLPVRRHPKTLTVCQCLLQLQPILWQGDG